MIRRKSTVAFGLPKIGHYTPQRDVIGRLQTVEIGIPAGLDAFKAKFNPEEWEPIYAIAEGASFPPRALYAIAGAFSGGVPIRLVLRALLRA